MNLFIRSLLLLGLAGCAAPGELRIPEEFIPARDLDVVSLTREALRDAGRGRYADAELQLLQARSLAPQNRKLRLNLAVVLERQGRYEEAETVFRDLLAENSEYIPAWSGLARLYVSKEEYESARETFAVIIDKLQTNRLGQDGPQKWELEQIRGAYRSLSALEFRLGNEEASACYSEDAIRVTPNPPLTEKVRHARTLISIGRFADARTYLRDHVERGKPFELAHQLALAQYGLQEREAAFRICTDLLDQPAVPPEVESDCTWLAYLERGLEPVDEEELVELTESEIEELEEEKQEEWEEKLPRLALGDNPARLYMPDELTAGIMEESERLEEEG